MSGVIVSDAWVRPAPLAGGATALYFRLESNQEVDDRLVEARSPASGSIEMHATMWDGDVAHMSPVEAIDLPAGDAIVIEPGGLHLMLVDLVAPLEPGDLVPVTLRFEQAGEIRVVAEVRQP